MLYSQRVCGGCHRVLTYPLGSISCRCRNCNTVNASQHMILFCSCCKLNIAVPPNTLSVLCPSCLTIMDIPEGLLPPVEFIDLDHKDLRMKKNMYVSLPVPIKKNKKKEREEEEKKKLEERRREMENKERERLMKLHDQKRMEKVEKIENDARGVVYSNREEGGTVFVEVNEEDEETNNNNNNNNGALSENQVGKLEKEEKENNNNNNEALPEPSLYSQDHYLTSVVIATRIL